jgi:hypothetical protein
MTRHPSTWFTKRCPCRRRSRPSGVWIAEQLEDRTLLSGTMGAVTLPSGSAASWEVEPNGNLQTAVAITPGVPTSGTIAPNDVDVFRLTTTGDGRLFAQLQTEGPGTRLSLLDGQGRLIVQSDGTPSSHRESQINQAITAGTYYLQVKSLGGVDAYSLTTELTAGSAPMARSAVGEGVSALAHGDFNRDGIMDLATANSNSGDVSVLLGRGDGTFHEQTPVAVAGILGSLIVAYLNDDNYLDLATTNISHSDAVTGLAGEVSVLLGRGDGTFQKQCPVAVGSNPQSLVVAYLNDDSYLDLATANIYSHDISVLLGCGDGTFQPEGRLAVGGYPVSLVVANLNGDRHPDLAIANSSPANSNSGNVSVLLGRGDGTFQEQSHIAVASGAGSLVVADFNGDRHPDLATANFNSGNVSVLLGGGDGTFQEQPPVDTRRKPVSLVVADLDGDGRPDLALTNSTTEVSMLFGHGDGTFQEQRRLDVGGVPRALVVADLNGDGRPDLATANNHPSDSPGLTGSDEVAVLLGRGDGTFLEKRRSEVGARPLSLVVADLNGDGRPDLATASSNSGDVSVLLGRGDGTFQEQHRFAVAGGAGALVVADLNGDGRLDLATVVGGDYDQATDLYSPGGVAVLLGRGDGTFQEQRRVPVAGIQAGVQGSLVVADLNGDSRPDLATLVSSRGPGKVAVLLGRGDGTFQEQRRRFAVGNDPGSLVVADLNSDSRPDLAIFIDGPYNQNTGRFGSIEVSVLLGRGDGTFQKRRRFAVGVGRGSLAVADLNADGRPDLVTVNWGRVDPDDEFTGPAEVSVLLGRGHGAFQKRLRPAVGVGRGSPVVADLDGDGRPDLATADGRSGDVSVLLGRGDGTFLERRHIAVGDGSGLFVVADLNGDGRPDLATATGSSLESDSSNVSFSDVRVGLNLGGGTFSSPGSFATTSRATPLLADLDRDGADDVFVIDRAGEILWRKGRPPDPEPGSFEPPVIVNPGTPSRDVVVLKSDQGPLVASVDARADAVSLYARRDGRFLRIGSLPTGRLPAQVAAADLDRDGFGDLVVRNAGDGTASIYLGDGTGNFRKRGDDLPIGLGASDIRLDDLDQSGTVDLIVTNQSTGDVRILYNRGDATFPQESRYRAGIGPYGVVDDGGTPIPMSLEETAGVAVGTFTQGGVLDLVTLNPGSNTLGVLDGLGDGAFANPRRIVTQQPAQVIGVGDFDGDGVTDVALLEAGQVAIALGDGHGGFKAPFNYNTGLNSTGLSVADVGHDGKLDLLIGNDFGDVLVLLGNGEGTFRPFQNAVRDAALAVADLDGDGHDDFIVASQPLDQVTVSYGGPNNPTAVANHSSGLLAPGAVVLADLNGDGHRDLVVANSGSNNVMIYPGLDNGQFGPALNRGNSFSTGTDPVGITVADADGDGRPNDLVVANRGSNDVSILLGSGQGAGYTLVPGPRLRTGSGPMAAVVRDFNGDGTPDIVVSDSLSNDVRQIPGVGGGFFADQNARIIPVGINPGPVFVTNTDRGPGIITVNQGSDDITLVTNLAGGRVVTSRFASGGDRPVAAVADDFNGDNLLDLVVGNRGDGRLALLLSGGNGFDLEPLPYDLPNLTDLALAGFGGGRVGFYATTEGGKVSDLLTFDIPIPLMVPSAILPTLSLVSLTDSALTLISTLLTVSLDMPATPFDGVAFQDGATTPVPPLATATNPPAQATGSDTTEGDAGGTDEAGDPEDTDNGPDSQAPPWLRLLLGLDEALERSRRASHDKVFPEDGPAAPNKRLLAALDRLLARWRPAVRLPQGLKQGLRPVGEGVIRAIDEAIRSLWPEELRPSQPTPNGVDGPAAAARVIDEAADPAQPQDMNSRPSPESGIEGTEPLSVSLTVTTALVAYRISHPRRRRQGRCGTGDPWAVER